MGKYNHSEVELKLQKYWEQERVYAYTASSKKETFVIDSPPPTVSGALHIGHVFSYTQTDILARFHRQRGKNVFYPMGWDDNGLPTEKRTQDLYGVYCDPALPVDKASFPLKKLSKKTSSPRPLSRKNFLELCQQQVLEDEIKYKKLWNHLALSVDWKESYQTINPYSQSLAQLSFLDLLEKSLAESRLSPVLWDCQFQTAVAQADIEDRPKKGFYYDIAFSVGGEGGEFVISTTRPELLPACVAVVAHPEDHRYKKLFGRLAVTPLFSREVPILPSPHADPKKGTGILMICTFGDMEDVSFSRKQKLPILQIIDDKGFFINIPWGQKPFFSLKKEEAKINYSLLKNLRILPGRKKIVELLKGKGYLRTEPRECQQNVKFYEKGDFPLEILPKRQWYIKILDHKEALLKQGAKISWHPPSMRKRYEQWVEGLNQDWCISRQRAYGVPFPVWYKADEEGGPDYSQVLTPKIESFKTPLPPIIKKTLPVDPLQKTPPGFKESERDGPGGFIADKDVMDTWATSSLTPYINSGWLWDKKRQEKLFPADLRPQAHEIIRTWAFYTIAKAYFHEKQIPWKNIAISGWVVTPQRAKMSKSKGNALEPENLIKVYSADALRYWAGKARLGQDTAYDEELFKVGKRLSTKIFNAGQFVFLHTKDFPWIDSESCWSSISSPIDRAWVKKLLNIKNQATQNLECYNYARALEIIEAGFWSFCDNYLELIKSRVYQLKDRVEGISGKKSLDYSLHIFLKLFAPYLPYVTEQLWQNRYQRESSSVHNSLWGDSQLCSVIQQKESMLERAFAILEQARSGKSLLKKSLASPLKSLKVTAQPDHLKELDLYKEDIAKATHVAVKKIWTEEDSSLTDPIVQIHID